MYSIQITYSIHLFNKSYFTLFCTQSSQSQILFFNQGILLFNTIANTHRSSFFMQNIFPNIVISLVNTNVAIRNFQQKSGMYTGTSCTSRLSNMFCTKLGENLYSIYYCTCTNILSLIFPIVRTSLLEIIDLILYCIQLYIVALFIHYVLFLFCFSSKNQGPLSQILFSKIKFGDQLI